MFFSLSLFVSMHSYVFTIIRTGSSSCATLFVLLSCVCRRRRGEQNDEQLRRPSKTEPDLKSMQSKQQQCEQIQVGAYRLNLKFPYFRQIFEENRRSSSEGRKAISLLRICTWQRFVSRMFENHIKEGKNC